MKESEIRSLKKRTLGMSGGVWRGGWEEMRGKGSSKRRLLLVDIEMRKRGYKGGQLEDRMKG